MSEKKKEEEKKIHTYYDIKGDKLITNLKKCPRCGAFMAHHKGPVPRWACGGCSYTEYIETEKVKQKT